MAVKVSTEESSSARQYSMNENDSIRDKLLPTQGLVN